MRLRRGAAGSWCSTRRSARACCTDGLGSAQGAARSQGARAARNPTGAAAVGWFLGRAQGGRGCHGCCRTPRSVPRTWTLKFGGCQYLGLGLNSDVFFGAGRLLIQVLARGGSLFSPRALLDRAVRGTAPLRPLRPAVAPRRGRPVAASVSTPPPIGGAVPLRAPSGEQCLLIPRRAPRGEAGRQGAPSARWSWPARSSPPRNVLFDVL